MRQLTDTETLDSHSLTALLDHCKARVDDEERADIEEEAEVIFDLRLRIEAKARRKAAINALRVWAITGGSGGAPRGSKRQAKLLAECLECRSLVPPSVLAWLKRCETDCRGTSRGWACEWVKAVRELDEELGLC